MMKSVQAAVTCHKPHSSRHRPTMVPGKCYSSPLLCLTHQGILLFLKQHAAARLIWLIPPKVPPGCVKQEGRSTHTAPLLD